MRRTYSKKVRGIVLFLLTVVLANCLVMPVSADIWVDDSGQGDEFFYKNYDNCLQTNCTYIANGKNGYVTVYKSPEDKTVLRKIKNGTKDRYDWSYYESEGTVWCSYIDYSGDINGWVLESDLILVYDYWSFEFYYDDEIENVKYEKLEINGDYAYLYEYPGAPAIKDKIYVDYTMCCDKYEDEMERLWSDNGSAWICIDNPTALPQELYPDGLPEMRGASDAAVRTNWTPFIIVASLVTGVAAVTGILLLFIYRKHKSKKNNSEEV